MPRPEPDDLARFSRDVLAGSAAIEALGPTEHRLRWAIPGRSGSITTAALRSGVTLSASVVEWDRPWSMAVDHGASAIKLILTRGPGPRLGIDGDEGRPLRGGQLHVSCIQRPTRLGFAFDDVPIGARHEELALEVSRPRLLELMGATSLPDPIERILAAHDTFPSRAVDMGPALHDRFDEITSCDARGPARPVYVEAMGLELLAGIIDRIEESAATRSLTAHDTARLEHARAILVARMEAPPTLPELARLAGLNEFKLKAGFREHFGQPVFAYLRAHRMREAERLLRSRAYNVTEVALRVGYANPSKFAAAFKRHFGHRPSELI